MTIGNTMGHPGKTWRSGEKPRTVLRNDGTCQITVYGVLPGMPGAPQGTWDSRIVADLMTTSRDKLWDNFRATRAYDIGLRLISMDVTAEDSEEPEDNSRDIAMGKIDISGHALTQLTRTEAEKLADKMEIPDLGYVLQVAEDRGNAGDPRLRDYHEFQALKDHPDLRDAFLDGADFPGHRFKELVTCLGGLGPYQEMLERAYESLPVHGSTFHDAAYYQDMSPSTGLSIAYAFKPFRPDGAIPMHPDGIVIEVVLKNILVAPMSLEEKADERMGVRAFDGFDFSIPAGQHKNFQQLRDDLADPWFDEHSHIALAWQAFAKLYGVPERGQVPALNSLIVPERRVALVGDVPQSFSKAAARFSGTSGQAFHVPVAPGRAVPPPPLEQTLFPANALVLMPYKNLEGELNKALSLVRMFRIVSEAATLKALYDPRQAGCPIVIADRDMGDKLAYMANAFYRHKFSGFKPSDIFTVAASHKKALSALRWDPMVYQAHDPADMTIGDLLDQDRLAAITGVRDWGYVRAGLVTASNMHPTIIQDAEKLGYVSAAQGVTLNHGGGSRHGMGALTVGAIQAYRDGHRDFLQQGERWATASLKEGSVSTLSHKYGLEVTAGRLDNGYVCFEDRFHYHEAGGYAARKHMVIGLPNSLLAMGGGWGTGDEQFQAAEHNLSVLKFGQGIHPGFYDSIVGDKNKLAKPILFVDRPLQAGRMDRYWSTIMNKLFSPNQLTMMGATFYPDMDSALDVDANRACALGYDVWHKPRTAISCRTRVSFSAPDELRP
jgi:hypothetical protein